MYFFYFISLLPVLIGLYLWHKDCDVVWWEWILSCVLCLLTAVIFNWISFESKCHDREILSGHVTSATHHPYWQSRVKVEEYRTETYTTGSGKDAQTHTRQVYVGYHYDYTNHPEYWSCDSSFGSYVCIETHEISKMFFDEISQNLCKGKLRTDAPYKSNFYKGDRNEYIADNATGYVYPTTRWKSFRNRIKATQSLYSFAPVGTNVSVFAYPSCGNPFESDRLIGTATKTITLRDFDRLCSYLGPIKKVNLIVIGFGDVPSDIAHYQEAKWIGGRKNDLVLCYGGEDPLSPTWSYVFGWTNKEIVKQNLQTIMLNNPIDNTILPIIESEIKTNYEIKEWRDFNYLEVDPPTWAYWVYLLTLMVTQGLLWFWIIRNNFNNYRRSYGKHSRR